jgi:3',5'-cyclic AMP phosphodiesterase CpdA
VVRLAHISDLHFGAADGRALRALCEALNAARPDAVVATGDITQAGRRREFEQAAQFFRRLPRPLMAIPGNHDAPVFNPLWRFADTWGRFRRILKSPPGAVLDLKGARLIGLNSARAAGPSLDWSRGRLSTAQIVDAARAALEAPPEALKVVALHHPMALAEGRAGQAVVARAEEALRAFGTAGVDLILTGHVHLSRADVLDGARTMVAATAGTAASTRQRGEAPSFNLIDGDGGVMSISMCGFDSGGYAEFRRAHFRRGPHGWRRE